MSIAVQDVSAWVEVNGAGFRLKSAEIERDTSRTIGKAVLKGFPEDIESIVLGADVDVFIATESSTKPWAEDLSASEQVFGGYAHSLKQDEEGVITLEAYDASQTIFDKTVKLNEEGSIYTDAVLIDVMREAYGTVTQDLSGASKRTPYVAPPDDLTPGNLSIQQRPWQFGSADRGEPLINVIDALTTSLGAEMWVDRRGVIRIQAYPEYTPWETPFVTEIEAGEETRNAERIIFQGNPVSQDLGQAGSFVNQQTSPESGTRIAPDGEEPEAPEKTIVDRNVTTQEGADNQSFNRATEEDQRRDYGTVTIIGNPELELFDHVIIPQIDFEIIDGAMSTTTLENRVQRGEYKVDGITHTVNSEDGFLTKVNLSPPVRETYSRCTVESGTAISQEYLAHNSNQRQEAVVRIVDGERVVIPDETEDTSSVDL